MLALAVHRAHRYRRDSALADPEKANALLPRFERVRDTIGKKKSSSLGAYVTTDNGRGAGKLEHVTTSDQAVDLDEVVTTGGNLGALLPIRVRKPSRATTCYLAREKPRRHRLGRSLEQRIERKKSLTTQGDPRAELRTACVWRPASASGTPQARQRSCSSRSGAKLRCAQTVIGRRQPRRSCPCPVVIRRMREIRPRPYRSGTILTTTKMRHSVQIDENRDPIKVSRCRLESAAIRGDHDLRNRLHLLEIKGTICKFKKPDASQFLPVRYQLEEAIGEYGIRGDSTRSCSSARKSGAKNEPHEV